MMLSHIAERVFNAPLLYHPGKAEAFLAAFGGRFAEGGVYVVNPPGALDHVAFAEGRPSMGRLGDQLGRIYDRYGELPFDVVDNVAVIPIEGTLVHKGAFVGKSSGRTSYQGIQTQVARAKNSPAIKGAVFEIDSFGGEAAGAFDTADMIADLSAVKPTIAILTDNAASGGYALAAPARQIVAPAFGQVGSIGVVKLHVDFSRMLENDGIKVTIMAAGAHKADGNQFQPLSADLRARLNAEIEEMRQTFADHVGRYRGKRFTAAQAMATEAQTYRSAEALALGLIDAIGKPAEAFDAFIAAVNKG